MQTFLPYADFQLSARALDWRRLGKQRVEALQVIRALTDPSYGWQHHPAVRMWRGHLEALEMYRDAMVAEWIRRGYQNTMAVSGRERAEMPEWLGDSEFHASHRSNLLRKDAAYYGQFGWAEPADLPYVWPPLNGRSSHRSDSVVQSVSQQGSTGRRVVRWLQAAADNQHKEQSMSDLKQKLEAAGKKAVEQREEKRARTIKGSHLVPQLVELAKAAECDIRSDKSFHVIVGKAGKALRVSVAQRGGVVYLVGFSIAHPAVKEITEESARARHIGRARGEFDFETGDEAIVEAFKAALERINVPAPAEEPKKERKPRVPKAIDPKSAVAVEEMLKPAVADLVIPELGEGEDALEEGEEVVKL